MPGAPAVGSAGLDRRRAGRPISPAVPFTSAAATPLAAGTAYEVLARLAVSAGSSLLVLGGSGGVGLVLLQRAAASGIAAVAVGHRARHEQMLRLSAASCIDYSSQDVAATAVTLAGGRVDALADLDGGTLAQAALPASRPGGQIAAIASPVLDLDQIVDDNITVHGVLIGDDGDRTRRLAALLAGGLLRPVISHLLPLAAAAQAHQIVESGHAGGKIVLEIPALPSP